MSHWGELQQKLCHPGQRWNRAAVAFDESGMLAEGSLPDQAPMVRALLHPRTRRACAALRPAAPESRSGERFLQRCSGRSSAWRAQV
jgi:hypothetical protein